MARKIDTTETTTTTRKTRKARKARKARRVTRRKGTRRAGRKAMPPICRALARRIVRLVALGVSTRDASRIAVAALAKAVRA